jgi:hypothetical protein
MSRKHTGESGNLASCWLKILTMCSDLLDAVLSCREVVTAALSESARKSLDRGEEVYIGVLAAGGWECGHIPISSSSRCLMLTWIV